MKHVAQILEKVQLSSYALLVAAQTWGSWFQADLPGVTINSPKVVLTTASAGAVAHAFQVV